MIAGFWTAGVTTIKDADTWISSATVKSQMPVCLVCASTADAYKVEISDDDGDTWTTIADLASDGNTVMDWMFYVTKKASTQVKTTGTGFLRVQGDLVAA